MQTKARAILVLSCILVLPFAYYPAHAASRDSPTPVGYSTHRLPNGRTYDLYVPPALSPHPPLVIVLHGRGQNAAHAESTFRMSSEADDRGFVVAYGQSVDSTWNAGTCCGGGQPHGTDDIGYLDGVVHQVSALVPRVSPALRVVGFSTGGMLAYTYACERPTVVGVAAVAGAWVAESPCNRGPVRWYHTHGRADAYVPYEGGYSPLVGATFEPVGKLKSHIPPHSPFWLHTVADGIHAWPPFASAEIVRWLRL